MPHEKNYFFMFHREYYAHTSSFNVLTVTLIHKKFYRKHNFERVYIKNNKILQILLKLISIKSNH